MARVPAKCLLGSVRMGSEGVRLTERARLRLDGDVRPVRVRQLVADLDIDPDDEDRFLDACERAERLSGEGIDHIVAYDSGNAPYIATESVGAVTIGQLNAASPGGLEPAIVALIGEEVARGLTLAHSLTPALVHGSIDLDSIVITPDGRARLTDLAFGRLSRGLAGEISSATGEIVQYQAPEQLAGQALSPRSDLFSLGAILYETITGVPAFAGDNPMASRRMLQAGRYAPIPSVRPSTPHALIGLVHRLLSPRPEHRPAATRVAGSLTALVDSTEDVRAELVELVAEAADPQRRRTMVKGGEVQAYARALLEGDAPRISVAEMWAAPGAGPLHAPVDPVGATVPHQQSPPGRAVERTGAIEAPPRRSGERLWLPWLLVAALGLGLFLVMMLVALLAFG